MPDLQKGLIGHWTMNSADTDGSTIRDRSAYDNHGTLNGSPATGQPSPVGEGYKFDGSNDRIKTSLQFDKNDFTYSAWVYFQNINNRNDIIDSLESSSSEWARIQVGQNGNFRFTIDNNGTKEHAVGTSASNEEWYHVVGVRSNDDMTLYLNGEVDATNTHSESGTIEGLESESIGAQALSNTNENVDGKISDVRVYNRALSQSEVNQLYNFRGSSRKSQTTVVAGDSLQAWYPFLQSGAADKSGNGNDGTVNGATYNGSGGPEGLGAYDFSGDNIESPISVDQDNTGQDYTVSAWFNSNDVTQGDQGIIGQDNGGFDFFIELSRDSNGELMVATGSDTQIKPSGTINSNEWNNIVVLLKGSDILYSLNGEPIQDTGVDRSNYGGGQESILAIGSISYDSGEDFNGEISDVRVYNKALSNSEINQLYNPKSVNLDRGLVGHWSMNSEDTDNGMIRDRSAYDNHGALNGSPNQNQSSIIEDSFDFNGNGDNIETGSFSSPTNAITLSAWLYPSTISGDNRQWAVKDANANQGFRSYISEGNSVHWKIDGNEISGSGLTVGEWNHLVLTWDSNTGDQIIYIDGSVDTSGSYTGSMTDDNDKFYIGGDGFQNYDWYEGNISDVRIYNRVLSEKEINALYNKRTTTSTNSEGIIAELYDTQTYYGSNSHPSNKTGLDEFFDTSNNGVSLEKKRVHNRPHIFWGSNSQGVGIGSVNPYPYYITTGDKDGYSWKIESSFVAPETGTYTFGIDSDDASDVLINGNVATSYYGAHGFSGNVNNHTGTVSLTQGNQYDFAARFEEGGGGDGIAVAWQKPSDSSLSKFPLNILSPIQT